MNAIAKDLTGFDFTWSSCALEHLGSIDAGIRFLLNQAACLKPGGWAVHTTEYNIFSNAKTWVSGGTVLFRRKDLDVLQGAAAQAGLELEAIDYSLGNLANDWFIDFWPYKSEPHLKLLVDGDLVTTSIILILRRVGASVVGSAAPTIDTTHGMIAPAVDRIPTQSSEPSGANPADELARIRAERDIWRSRYERVIGEEHERNIRDDRARLEETCKEWRTLYERLAAAPIVKQLLWVRRCLLRKKDPVAHISE
ncbi:MAG: hypothetical protein H0W83_11365 [Planctomycetes bacterium]|nr:hypothetical protein [Planctomycetota bacterium]